MLESEDSSTLRIPTHFTTTAPVATPPPTFQGNNALVEVLKSSDYPINEYLATGSFLSAFINARKTGKILIVFLYCSKLHFDDIVFPLFTDESILSLLQKNFLLWPLDISGFFFFSHFFSKFSNFF